MSVTDSDKTDINIDGEDKPEMLYFQSLPDQHKSEKLSELSTAQKELLQHANIWRVPMENIAM